MKTVSVTIFLSNPSSNIETKYRRFQNMWNLKIDLWTILWDILTFWSHQPPTQKNPNKQTNKQQLKIKSYDNSYTLLPFDMLSHTSSSFPYSPCSISSKWPPLCTTISTSSLPKLPASSPSRAYIHLPSHLTQDDMLMIGKEADH